MQFPHFYLRSAQLIIASVVMMVVICSVKLPAQVPSTMAYDGYLTDATGKPLQNGKYDFVFSLYTSATQGSAIWLESQPKVQVNNGSFHVLLGKGNPAAPLNLPFDQQYYLGITIGGNPELSPRQPLQSMPYSFHSHFADAVPDSSIGDAQIKSVSWSKITGVNGQKNGVPSQVWSLKGNVNSNPPDDFLGTTDARDLTIKTNNQPRMDIYSAGNVDINSKLLVKSSVTSRISSSEGAFYLADSGYGLSRIGGSGDVKLYSGSGNLFLQSTNVGLGQANPLSKLDVKGGLTLGTTYSGTYGSPLNGAIIEGNVGIGTNQPTEKLDVNGNSVIRNSLTIKGIAHVNNSTESPNQSTGALVVDGGAGIGGNIHMGKSLFVGGDAHISGNFEVSGTGKFNNLHVLHNDTTDNNLYIGGKAGIGASYSNVNLNVRSASGSDIPFNVEVGTDSKFRVENSGHTLITSTVDGSASQPENYGLELKTAKQGMLIKVDRGGDFNSDIHLVDFWQNSTRKGSIHGQTAGELAADPVSIAQDVATAAKAVALGIAIGYAIAEPADIVSDGADIAFFAFQTTYNLLNAGVAYESGSGDYAEWLERANHSETMQPGDIVGVNGGHISKNTKDVQQMMVVSTAPIVLGNTPPAGKEKLCEKVAFLGQVPVKVIGPVKAGDYIIPSGLNDGSGIAVAQEMMSADEFSKVVCRAWMSSKLEGTKLIKAVIGINAADVATVVKRQEHENQLLRTEVVSMKAKVLGLNVLETQVAALTKAVQELKQSVQVKSSNSMPSILPVVSSNNSDQR